MSREPHAGAPLGGGSWTRRLRIRVGVWILRESATLHGAAAIVLLSFLGSAFVPIMLEPFLIILTTNLPALWRRFALCFAVGSVLGGVATYVIGWLFIESIGMSIVRFWGEEAAFEQVLAHARSTWWLVPVGIVSVGPGPMKLVTMAAGAANLAFPPFLLVLVVGRLVRFYGVSYMSRLFGKRMHEWYVAGRRRTVYIAVCAVGAVLAIAYLTARVIIF
jgi:membrane protein YqaA with SNARE-associated domain